MRIASLGSDTHSYSCRPAGDPGGLLAPGARAGSRRRRPPGTLDEEEESDNGSRLNVYCAPSPRAPPTSAPSHQASPTSTHFYFASLCFTQSPFLLPLSTPLLSARDWQSGFVHCTLPPARPVTSWPYNGPVNITPGPASEVRESGRILCEASKELLHLEFWADPYPRRHPCVTPVPCCHHGSAFLDQRYRGGSGRISTRPEAQTCHGEQRPTAATAGITPFIPLPLTHMHLSDQLHRDATADMT